MSSNLTLTIYDIIGYLIPGSVLVLTVIWTQNIILEVDPLISIFVLIISGYIVGSFLHLIGQLLFRPIYSYEKPKTLKEHLVNLVDKVIRKFPLLRVKETNKGLKKQVEDLLKKKFKVEVNSRLDLFQFSDTFVASLDFAERSTLLAKEAFFRSITALILVEVVYLLYLGLLNLYLLVVAVVALELARFGREFYRNIKNNQIYTLTLFKLRD